MTMFTRVALDGASTSNVGRGQQIAAWNDGERTPEETAMLRERLQRALVGESMIP